MYFPFLKAYIVSMKFYVKLITLIVIADECQVSSEPKLSLVYQLNVVGMANKKNRLSPFSFISPLEMNQVKYKYLINFCDWEIAGSQNVIPQRDDVARQRAAIWRKMSPSSLIQRSTCPAHLMNLLLRRTAWFLLLSRIYSLAIDEAHL